jgi:GPH family glycoside/pentoside/hexuronide:cation symporter
MLILSIFGYVADVPQSAESLFGIKLSLSLIPAAIALLAVIALLFYPLDDHRVAEIGQELAQRKLQNA